MDASSSSQDSIKSSGSNQANKNRKGSLSAVIDKLKSARHVNDESPPNTPTLSTPSQSIAADVTTTTSSTSSGHSSSKEKITSSNTPSISISNGMKSTKKFFIFWKRFRAFRAKHILRFHFSFVNINYIGEK